MYKETVGIEVHLEIKTNTKFFSGSKSRYGAAPNTCVSVIDAAHPGTLPLINAEVIKQGLRAALLLNCDINQKMHFDRKNYFYPDLPKGYQITQNRTPIGVNGYVTLDSGKKIGIHDIHLEEDTAKSTHVDNYSYLDLNRAGIPLVEIVSQPDITSPSEAREYLEKLREIMVFAGISDCKIEEGSMRCDVNVSVSKTDVLGTRSEIKNVSSLTAVEKAIEAEKKRHIAILEKGEKILEDTRRFDEKKEETVRLRLKETGNDYRYFPEPDIPYIYISDEELESVKASLPLSGSDIKLRLIKEGISELNASKLIKNPDSALFIASLFDEKIDFNLAVNLMQGDILAYLNKNGLSLKETTLNKKRFMDLLDSFNNGVNFRIFRDIVSTFLSTDKDIKEILEINNITLIDDNKLDEIALQVIKENDEAVKDYQNGNERSMQFLMGMMMKKTRGGADPVEAKKSLQKHLAK